MATLTNLEFGTVADLQTEDGQVVGQARSNPLTLNQTWRSIPEVDSTVRFINNLNVNGVQVGVAGAIDTTPVYGNGPERDFMIKLAPGGITIRLKGQHLLWTLTDGLNNSPVRLMAPNVPADVPGGLPTPGPNQIWVVR